MGTNNAEWRRDPTGRHEYRYWDGEMWTDQVADGGATATDPYAEASAMPVPPPPPSGPPAVASQPQVVYVQQQGNGAAVTALVLGIIGIVLGLVPILALFALVCGVVGLVFGFVGRRNVARDPNRRGKGMATTGVVLGAIAIILSIIGFVIVSDAFDDLNDDLNNSHWAPSHTVDHV